MPLFYRCFAKCMSYWIHGSVMEQSYWIISVKPNFEQLFSVTDYWGMVQHQRIPKSVKQIVYLFFKYNRKIYTIFNFNEWFETIDQNIME